MRMQDAPSFRNVHDSLLERYSTALQHIASSEDRLSYFRRVSTSYLLASDALRAFFESEASHVGEDAKPSAELLKEIYLAWRRRDIVDASLAWARWLLSQGRGRDASDLIQRARAEVDGPSRQTLEDAWRHVVNESTKHLEKAVSSDDAMNQD